MIRLPRIDRDANKAAAELYAAVCGDCLEFPAPEQGKPSDRLLDAIRCYTMSPSDLYFCSPVAIHKASKSGASSQGGSVLPPLTPQSHRKAFEELLALVTDQAPQSLPSTQRLQADYFSSRVGGGVGGAALAPCTSDLGTLVRRVLRDQKISDCVDVGDAASGVGGGGVEGGEGEGGRGVVATRDVAQNEAVLSIPAKILINVDSALSSEKGDVFGQVRQILYDSVVSKPKGGPDDTAAEAGGEGEQQEEEEDGCSAEEAGRAADDSTVMLFLMREKKMGKDSKFSDFLDMLPKEMLTVLCSGDEDLAHELQGTPAERRLEVERGVVGESYDRLFPMLSQRFPDDFGGPGFARKDFVWARSVFDTRSVVVTMPDGKDVTCLVPCADMCNHDPHAQLSKPRYSALPIPCLDFNTLCPIKKGAQIFLNYGALSNEQLLLYYGFTVEGNPYDSVTLEIEPPEDDGLHMVKTLMLSHCNLASEHILRMQGPLSPKLIAAFRICFLSESDLDQERDPEAGPVSPDNEEMAVEAMVGGFKSMLGAFETTVEEDEEMLKSSGDGGNMSALRRACVGYRLGHKRILARAVALAEEMQGGLPELRQQWGEGGEDEEGSGGEGSSGSGGGLAKRARVE